MTEEIIKECKNCDALGIDSEIGVYYCCLSHRQDDLPKEFTCNDFTPDKQLKRLEQENKELKHRNENLRIALSTYEMPEVVKVLTDYRTGELQLQKNKLKKYEQALKEIKKAIADITYNHANSFVTYDELLHTTYKIQSIILGV